MSELLNAKRRESLRHNLLMNVSMLAVLGYLSASQGALADSTDENSPTVWIELGGQLEQMQSASEIFAPPFLANTPAADIAPMIEAQKAPRFGIGGESKITFTPRGTEWVLSAAVRYGRANGAKHVHQQTALPYVEQYYANDIFPQVPYNLFGDGQTNFSESHLVVDFKAGKDFGLGLFGNGGKSVFSAGVRYAQFTSNSDVTLHARPVDRFGAVHSAKLYYPSVHRYYGYRTIDLFRHTYTATFQAKRNTHAFGPSISWDASVPVIGNSEGVTLAMDWGLNAAILFGRQRVKAHHQTTGHYTAKTGARFKYPGLQFHHSSYARGPFDQARARTVTVPNVGGFAGVTLQKSITKISLGYRADLFFGAVDSGIDAPRKSDIGFYGPFANVSIGLGG